MPRRFRTVGGSLTGFVLLVMVAGASGCASRKAPMDDGSEIGEASVAASDSSDADGKTPEVPQDARATRSLFDGESLDGWETVDFGGQGEVHVEEGVLVLPPGEPMTGVRWTRPFPTIDYEIELMAQRESGTDFFCGLTFPVEDTFASLIIGGWGGPTCGISSFEDMDASENETRFDRSFEMNRWYAVKLRVTKKKIVAWIDEEKVIDIETTGRQIGTRPEVDLCKPLGLASYLTTAGLRDLRWREVSE